MLRFGTFTPLACFGEGTLSKAIPAVSAGFSSQLYLGSTLAAEILVAVFKPVRVYLSILKTDHSSPLLYHELDLRI